jgi:hypothetical protein
LNDSDLLEKYKNQIIENQELYSKDSIYCGSTMIAGRDLEWHYRDKILKRMAMRDNNHMQEMIRKIIEIFEQYSSK